MKYRIQTTLYYLTIFLESVIGIFLILGVVFSIMGLASSLDFLHLLDNPAHITEYLGLVATITLSIEFTKMLCTHSLDSVVEVLSMAIAREIIAHETTAIQNLLGVIAIAVLFTVRKYCFISQLDKSDNIVHRSLTKDTLNGLLHIRPKDIEAEAAEKEETAAGKH